MDATLANYLKILKTPAGAPPTGSVVWHSTDLLEGERRVEVSWTETSLLASGVHLGQPWAVDIQRSQEWNLASAQGLPTACATSPKALRWAGERIKECALGAAPECSWAIARNEKRRARP